MVKTRREYNKLIKFMITISKKIMETNGGTFVYMTPPVMLFKTDGEKFVATGLDVGIRKLSINDIDKLTNTHIEGMWVVNWTPVIKNNKINIANTIWVKLTKVNPEKMCFNMRI